MTQAASDCAGTCQDQHFPSESRSPGGRWDRSKVGGLWRPVVLARLQAEGQVVLGVVNYCDTEQLSVSIFRISLG